MPGIHEVVQFISCSSHFLGHFSFRAGSAVQRPTNTTSVRSSALGRAVLCRTPCCRKAAHAGLPPVPPLPGAGTEDAAVKLHFQDHKACLSSPRGLAVQPYFHVGTELLGGYRDTCKDKWARALYTVCIVQLGTAEMPFRFKCLALQLLNAFSFSIYWETINGK